MQVIREIAKKVAQIQNAGLGEFRIRDLNDEINKLLREKGHWEDRIKELGGPDYGKVGPKMLDQEGREVPGNRGYKYFGAAKDLPGVRELFEQEPPPPPRRTRAEIMRDIDADYYGYRDDDDGVLMPLEQEQEKAAIAKAVRQWKANKKGSQGDEENIYAVREVFCTVRCSPILRSQFPRHLRKLVQCLGSVLQNSTKTSASCGAQNHIVEPALENSMQTSAIHGAQMHSAEGPQVTISCFKSDEEEDDDMAGAEDGAEEQTRFIAHVPVPSQKEVEEALVRRKKLELLEKYASEVLQQESEEVKEMLGIQ
ncbi:hypothetical protein HPB48_014448 [Haemaphysalis longicornis]|uniref:Pre-mRNA-splicing factor ISY1 homolog n=1 Tax=Haemaphysalis longicornis TaxID=44386 RepID=A0A9J6H2L8_HAELO|nr:hypothetical protein HPB48_014448 [Haemaphysalis longicornis]